jgi:hypothetical protein
MFKSFYVQLDVNATDQSISALVSHAHDTMKNQVGDKSINVTHFQLIPPSTATDSHSIYYQFFYTTKQEIELRNELIANREKTYDSAEEVGLKIEKKLPAVGEVGMITYRMNRGEQQDNDITLIGLLSKALKDLDNSTVLDLIYHDRFDDDNIRHPFFNVYVLS